MRKITIGIPKAYLYYRYHIFWKSFFQNLGCNVVISQDTTKKTIEAGKHLSIDESCLSSKIYLGHVSELVNKCDYILVPRIENYGKGEKVCVKFNATFDLVNNLFENSKILDYNIEKTKLPLTLTYLKLGLKLNKNPIAVIKSYIKAKIEEKKYFKKKLQNQLKKLNSYKTKILIVSHPYNIYDNYIGSPIIKKLENMNIEIIYADIIDPKIAKIYASVLSPTLYWTYSKELIGAIGYYHYSVDGIIFLSTFPCGPDSLVNELMIRKITDVPITNILIDEQSSSVGLETRLESFIDIIKERRKQDEKDN